MIIKICGIKDVAAAKAAAEAGADLIGFVFAPTRRYIEPAIAAKIAKEVPQIKKVGVFVDEKIDKVLEIAGLCGLDYIQLHGHETADYARNLPKPVIKALRYGDDFSSAYADDYPAEFILLDNFSKEKIGGTGEKFDWQKAAGAVRTMNKPFLIAGGIGSDNVGEAIRIFHPAGIDVSGSLEKNDQKDPKLIREFIAIARREELQ